ncbi:MAG: hypothetical protein OCD01_20080 [Fibrobacterales bacterium]
MKIALLFGGTYQLGWGRAQNLAKGLAAKGHSVWYVDAIDPVLQSRRTYSAPYQHQGVNVLSHITSLPIARFPILERPNRLFLKRQLLKACTDINDIDILLFYGVPQPWIQELFINAFPKSRRIYDCADEKRSTFHDLINEKVGETVGHWEKQLLKRIDAVSAINQHLITQLNPHNTIESLALSNGYDETLFHHTSKPPCRSIRKLVFAGALNERLDIEKITHLANNPEIEIDFYGPYHPITHVLAEHPSIHYQGSIPYGELPSSLKQYDGGLIAYRNITSIQKSDPLKILQYFGCGLPVFSFQIDAWEPLHPYITFIEDTIPAQYNLPPSPELLIQNFSWDSKINHYEQWLSHVLQTC